MGRRTAVIIGGGLGGLGTAIRLASAGFAVTILEKNASTGGKVSRFEKDGFTWDTGPSLITMPHVIEELFSSAGRNVSDYLTLLPVSPTCRYFWSDGKIINEDEDFFGRPDVEKFMRYAEGIYDLSGEAFLNHPPSQFHRSFNRRNLPKLRHLPKVATFKSVNDVVSRRFSKNRYLQQLFNRFATYNGSDPYRCPATFNIIPYVEYRFGAWYAKGGMRMIAVALEKLARELGVTILTESAVTSIKQHGVFYLQPGDRQPQFLHADVIVSNADATYTHGHLMEGTEARALHDRMNRKEFSCSGFILYLAVSKQFSQLAHHNIFFTDDYPGEFREIFADHTLPHQPTIYVCITSRTDPDHAPPHCDNMFILVNSPTTKMKCDPEKLQRKYPQIIIERLEKMGLHQLSHYIVTHEVFTAFDFEKRDNATLGSLYGHASNTPSSALFRPPLRSKLQKNLYFVGGTTHPGGGIPMVLLSAKMVTRMILEGTKA